MVTLDTQAIAVRLLVELPDVPHWIETRSMLRSPHAQIFGAEHGDGVVVRLLHGAMAAISTIGKPDAPALASALQGATPMTPVVAQVESASHVAQLLKQIDSSADGREWSAER